MHLYNNPVVIGIAAALDRHSIFVKKVVPVAPGTCVVVFSSYYPPDELWERLHTYRRSLMSELNVHMLDIALTADHAGYQMAVVHYVVD